MRRQLNQIQKLYAAYENLQRSQQCEEPVHKNLVEEEDGEDYMEVEYDDIEKEEDDVQLVFESLVKEEEDEDYMEAEYDDYTEEEEHEVELVYETFEGEKFDEMEAEEGKYMNGDDEYEIKVNNTCLVSFSVEKKYQNETWCAVVPMDAYHLNPRHP